MVPPQGPPAAPAEPARLLRCVEHVRDQGRVLLETVGCTLGDGRLVPPRRPTDWTAL